HKGGGDQGGQRERGGAEGHRRDVRVADHRGVRGDQARGQPDQRGGGQRARRPATDPVVGAAGRGVGGRGVGGRGVGGRGVGAAGGRAAGRRAVAGVAGRRAVADVGGRGVG